MENSSMGTMDEEFTQKGGVRRAHIPQELITEVLIRLPVKSLLRFRCVSKSLFSFIDSKYFVRSHLDRSTEQSKFELKFILKQDYQISTNCNTAKLHYSDFDDGLGDKFVLENPCSKGLDVCGYCDGVFLLFVNKVQLALWNPSTQQHRILPCFPGFTDRLEHCWYNNRMGFGYDSAHDDYKVVSIQYAIDFYSDCEFHVWIFGLKSNLWRKISSDSLTGVSELSRECGCYAHGNLHWCCILNDTESDFEDIVAFDLAEETFSLLSRPVYPFDNVQKLYVGLNVLDGCLCINYVFAYQYFYAHGRRSFWVSEDAFLYIRKKDEDKFTWSLLYSVARTQLPPFLEMHDFVGARVLGCSRDGDKILLDIGFNYIVSYDLKEKSLQETEITKPVHGTVGAFVESLVRIAYGDCGEDEKEANNNCLL